MKVTNQELKGNRGKEGENSLEEKRIVSKEWDDSGEERKGRKGRIEVSRYILKGERKKIGHKERNKGQEERD